MSVYAPLASCFQRVGPSAPSAITAMGPGRAGCRTSGVASSADPSPGPPLAPSGAPVTLDPPAPIDPESFDATNPASFAPPAGLGPSARPSPFEHAAAHAATPMIA